MGRRQSRTQKRISRAPALGLVLVVLAVLLALAHLPGATGVPAVLAVWQRRLLGVAAVALPVYVAAAGLVLIAVGERARLSRQVIGLLLGSLVALAAVHARLVSGDLLRAGLAGKGGGIIGGALASALTQALGMPGLWATVVVAGAVCLGMLAGVPLASVGFGLRAVARTLVWLGKALWRLGRATLRWLLRSLGRAALAAGRTGRAWARRTWASALAVAREGGRRLSDAAERALPTVHQWIGRTWAAMMSAKPGEPVPVPAPATGPPLDLMTASAAPPAVEAPPAPVTEPSAAEADATADRRRSRPRSGRGTQIEGQERLEFSSVDFRLPPVSTLADTGALRGKARADPAETARALEQTLESFGVKARVVHWEVGPTVTRFEVQPEPGVKVQKITSLTNDIALNLAAQSVRIEAPIPGKSAVGIELPNSKASLVHLREILTADAFQKATSPLVVGVGKDIAGHPIVADLTEMPHLLIAGATGSGKSVMLNAMIASLLFRSTPRQIRLVMIDPKRVELTDYNGIPHMLTPVVTNPRQAASVLKDMLRVMEQRFELFAQAGARNIQSYNQLADVEPLPYIVIIIDELADLMMVAPADFEDIICRLAQMTRATGIHLVVATQRPSVDVITGLIKANIPSRLAFAVSSQVDSRTILDSPGADKLLGRGDMLFLPLGSSRPIRAQGAYIADDEIRTLVEWWRGQGAPVYDQQVMQAQETTAKEESADGERLIEAARLVVRSGYGSVSLLQRKMRIGYVTAARLIDELEARRIVGPVQGSNPREVLIGLDDLERLLRSRSAS